MNRSDIDNVKFYTMDKSKGGNLLAFATVTLTNGLVIKAKVMTGSKGLWAPIASFKTGKTKDDGKDEYASSCYFPDKEEDQAFQAAIIELWQKESGSTKSSSKPSGQSNGKSRTPTRTRTKPTDEYTADDDTF